MTFEARADAHGNVSLFSVDHADLRITNERAGVAAELLEGMPHSLLCASSQDELSVLLPAAMPVRPAIMKEPFSTQSGLTQCPHLPLHLHMHSSHRCVWSVYGAGTELVLDRDAPSWNACRELPYYLYPIHVSLTFVAPPTLSSAMYLLLLRFQARAYSSVVALIDTVATDEKLTKEYMLLSRPLRHLVCLCALSYDYPL